MLAVRPTRGTLLDFGVLTDALLETGLAVRSLPEALVVWDVPFPSTVTEKLNRATLSEESAGRPHLFAGRLEP